MTNEATYGLPSGETSTAAARVLILDDEPCISELLFEMLSILGYAPTKSFSPIEALRVLGEQEFDVVLTDYRMPEMNGDVFYRKAVEKHEGLRRRIVFLTGDTVSEETHRFIFDQGSRFLCKPFDVASVQQIISEVLEQEGVFVG